MIIAVPVNDQNVANHFTKAQRFALLDDRGNVLNYLDNPTLSSEGCHGKKRLIAQLLAAKVSKVMVKNIGQKLLAGNVLVERVAGRNSLATVLSAGAMPLTEASQGRECRTESKSHCCGSRRERARGLIATPDAAAAISPIKGFQVKGLHRLFKE
ncbi:hypothetical protein EA25_01175 [Vibrio navarrensis]|nr:hypothetical protein EA25_01175 [Vibrio navarrensis]